MAAEYTCADCKCDGTRCDCHKKRKHYYRPSWREVQKEELESSKRELLSLEHEWLKLGIKIKLAPWGKGPIV